ncbi:flagellar hook capping FlgD N-terminal domain-containing protein, partial [Alcaligenes pakistanensis]
MSTVNNDRNVLDPTSGAMAGIDARNKSAMAETEDRFLTMLITQLRNQDPLNPMDNAQVTTQMAQMSTVAGIQQLNTTLMAVAGQMDVSQSMQAANLIGKEVLVPGEKV